LPLVDELAVLVRTVPGDENDAADGDGADVRPDRRVRCRQLVAELGEAFFRGHRIFPLAATGQTPTTRPPRCTATWSCRFVQAHAWFGITVTTSPTSGRCSHPLKSTCPCSS